MENGPYHGLEDWAHKPGLTHLSLVCILEHDYTLCFIGSPYCNVSLYYNYNSIWPYYIVIYYPIQQIMCYLECGLLLNSYVCCLRI